MQKKFLRFFTAVWAFAAVFGTTASAQVLSSEQIASRSAQLAASAFASARVMIDRARMIEGTDLNLFFAHTKTNSDPRNLKAAQLNRGLNLLGIAAKVGGIAGRDDEGTNNFALYAAGSLSGENASGGAMVAQTWHKDSADADATVLSAWYRYTEPIDYVLSTGGAIEVDYYRFKFGGIERAKARAAGEKFSSAQITLRGLAKAEFVGFSLIGSAGVRLLNHTEYKFSTQGSPKPLLPPPAAGAGAGAGDAPGDAPGAGAGEATQAAPAAYIEQPWEHKSEKIAAAASAVVSLVAEFAPLPGLGIAAGLSGEFADGRNSTSLFLGANLIF